MSTVRTSLEGRALAQGIVLQPTQRQALQALDDLGEGVYLWGPAGRGKTWLLDGFSQVTQLRVARYHWYDFFTRLHALVAQRLHFGDRFTHAVDVLLGDCQVLCFDELQLADLDDTFMVERLLTTLHERRICLVVTSNQAPEDLLPDEDLHRWATPTIEHVRRHLAVCLVDDGVDHRTGEPAGTSAFASGRVLRPGAPAWDAAHRSWVLSDDAGMSNGGRPLPFRSTDGGLVVDFVELLGAPTGAADYAPALLAGLTVVGVPALDKVAPEARERFVVLLDLACELDVPVTLVLAYDGPLVTRALPGRTVSRLRLLET